MKNKRHQKIVELITNEQIGTQSELAEALQKHGFDVTQATVSRDIKAMGLIKIHSTFGNHIYAMPKIDNSKNDFARMKRTFSESVLNIMSSENMIVIHTQEGYANSVALVVENMNWPESIGDLAGDDTVFVVVRSREETPVLLEKMNELRK